MLFQKIIRRIVEGDADIVIVRCGVGKAALALPQKKYIHHQTKKKESGDKNIFLLGITKNRGFSKSIFFIDEFSG